MYLYAVPRTERAALPASWIIVVRLPKFLSVGQVVETDVAQSITFTITTIAQVTETDSAQSVTRVKTRAIGQVLEVESATGITRAGVLPAFGFRLYPVPRTKVIVPPASRVITIRKASGLDGTVGQVTETEVAQAVAWAPKRRFVTQVNESDIAQTTLARKTLTVAQITETDTVFAVSRVFVFGIAIETDLVFTVFRPGALKLDVMSAIPTFNSPVFETVSQLVTPAPRVGQLIAAVGQVIETDLATGIIKSSKKKIVVQSTELDTALAINVLHPKLLSVITEFDLAQTVVWAPKIRQIDRVLEFDFAQVFSVTGGSGGAVATRRELISVLLATDTVTAER